MDVKRPIGRRSEMQPNEHKLELDSLRDPIAHCTCGRWRYLGVSTEEDATEALRARISTQFEYHLAAVELEERRLRQRAQ